MRLLPSLALVSLLATSCGGSAAPGDLTNSGYKKLGQGDLAAAQEDFDAALAAIGTDDPLYLRAKMGSIEARTQSDPEAAKEEFLALQTAMPDKVDDGHFSKVAARLGDSKHFAQAIALLEAGKAAYPDSKALDALGAQLAEQATKGDDPAAVEALRGLGYVGD